MTADPTATATPDTDWYDRDTRTIAGVEKLRFFPQVAATGHGTYLTTPSGRQVLDLSASWTASGLGHAGAWLLMTYFVVIQPYLQDGWRKALERAIGTVFGFVIAMGLGLVIEVEWLLLALGVGGLVLGIWVRIKNAPYWAYTAALTVGIVLAEGASNSVVSTGEQRLWATVVGTGASLAAMAVLVPIYRRSAQRVGIDHY